MRGTTLNFGLFILDSIIIKSNFDPNSISIFLFFFLGKKFHLVIITCKLIMDNNIRMLF